MRTSDGSGALRRAGLQPAAALAVLLALAACTPAPTPALPAAAQGEWREFQGTWTAAGSRHVIGLGHDRQASVADLSGSLLLAGPSRPGVGFRAEAVVLNDSTTGMVGRSVWTYERGDQVFSELRGEGTATGNRITGSIVGGTGRYAGATGTYEFSWRFVLETEDGTVQGQSVGLKGRVRAGAAAAAARHDERRPAGQARAALRPGDRHLVHADSRRLTAPAWHLFAVFVASIAAVLTGAFPLLTSTMLAVAAVVLTGRSRPRRPSAASPMPACCWW